MSDSTTNLDTISQSQSQKEATANALFDAGSPATLYGRRASTCAGLVWGYYGGKVLIAGVSTSIANGTLTLDASDTNYIEADPDDGTVSSNTTAFTSGAVPLYTAVTGASTVTSYTDHRTTAVGFLNQAGATGTAGGDLTGTYPDPTIASNAVTLAKMAQMATASFLGRNTASTGNVEVLSATTATAILNAMVGDSGSGGTKGLVPAPSAGDAAALKYLKADGTWATVAGGVSSVANSDSTLTISPTTGSVVASLNLGHANTWTASQKFRAGASGAGTAGAYLQSGTLMAAPEVGALEVNNNLLYFTVSGPTRKQVPLVDNSGGTGRIAFINTSSNVDGTGNLTWNGAGVGITGFLTLSGTLTLSALTSGRIPYVGGSSTIVDSANLVWDNSNTRLGVGPAAPNQALDVNGSTNGDVVVQVRNGTSGSLATSAFWAVNSSSKAFSHYKLSAGYTTNGLLIASEALLFNDDGPFLAANIASQDHIFSQGGFATTNEKLRIKSTGLLVQGATAVPAGGTAATGLMFSSTANFGVFFGSGAPTLSAAKGSLYLRSDGSGTADRAYINTNGSTTWTAISTAA